MHAWKTRTKHSGNASVRLGSSAKVLTANKMYTVVVSNLKCLRNNIFFMPKENDVKDVRYLMCRQGKDTQNNSCHDIEELKQLRDYLRLLES